MTLSLYFCVCKRERRCVCVCVFGNEWNLECLNKEDRPRLLNKTNCLRELKSPINLMSVH